ncbi:MAG: glycolate oxidase subunit GlcE [Thiotrichales bacterium]
MTDQDLSESLQQQVRAAADKHHPLRIGGGDSKAFYGRAVDPAHTVLDLAPHRGVVAYEPTELVITARAGTPLAEIEALLDRERQQLAFEPPDFSGTATVGGMVAAGLSGPRRPFGGAVRDAVLGVTLLNGQGQILKFGGQVMKNVAGYDVARLQCGALGTLGVLLYVSLKLQPKPPAELTLTFDLTRTQARERFTEWSRRPWSITATAHDGERAYVRLAGVDNAVGAARAALGGEALPDAAEFWRQLKNHQLPFFADSTPLWRVSLPPGAPSLEHEGPEFHEWNGTLRWLYTDAAPTALHAIAQRLGGHATQFRAQPSPSGPFQPLTPGSLALHQRLKRAFDPHCILNPGRLYPEL